MKLSQSLSYEREVRRNDGLEMSELSLRANLDGFLGDDFYASLIPQKGREQIKNIQYMDDMSREEIFGQLFKNRGANHFDIFMLRAILPYKYHLVLRGDMNLLDALLEYTGMSLIAPIELPSSENKVLIGDYFLDMDKNSFDQLDRLFYLLERDIILNNYDIQYANFCEIFDCEKYQHEEGILLQLDLIGLSFSKTREWSFYKGYRL